MMEHCTKENPKVGDDVFHEETEFVDECDDVIEYKCINCGSMFKIWYSM